MTLSDKEQIEASPERHPLEPFLPKGAKVLMLGSFPPQRQRWSMDFYYPNFINDMWRIMGIVFFGDKDRFVSKGRKGFELDAIVDFCKDKGIALSDTAVEVVRTKDNASDKFLEVTEPRDIAALLALMPDCRAVITTGEKAAETFAGVMGCDVPKVGCSAGFLCGGRELKLYRMPSTSRAYPKPLEEKAAAYEAAFSEIGVL